MLKRLFINNKMTPIPVPLRNLAEVSAWVDETLVSVGQTVTSAILDGKDILDIWDAESVCSAIKVHPEMRLEIRIESPEDLALQSLDAVHALVTAILGRIKVLAVHLWQSRKNDMQPELKAVIDDITLVGDLLDRILELGLIGNIDLSQIEQSFSQLKEILGRLTAAFDLGSWKDAAQILLRDAPTAIGLESLLKNIASESERAHACLVDAIREGYAETGGVLRR